MLRAASGLSLQADPRAAGHEAAAAALAGLGADARELLVFASNHHAAGLAEVVAGAQAAAPRARVVAAAGYGALTERREIEEAEAVAALAIAGDALQLTPHAVPAGQAEGRALGEAVAGALGASAAVVMLPGADAGWPEEILAGLPGALVVGAGLSGPWEPPAVAIANRLVPEGTLGLGLGGAIRVAGGHTPSMRPVGPLHRVTAARGERVLALDGRPALDVLAEDVGAELAEAAATGDAPVFVGVPRDAAATSLVADGYLVRALQGVDEAEGALIAPGAAVEGGALGFVVRDSAGARADLDALLARLAAETADTPPAFGLYFNCAARGRDLHGAEDVDVTMIRTRFPDLPLIGLFGSFELAAGRQHAYTGVLLLVGEA